MREFGRSIALGMLAGITLAIVFASGFFVRDLIQIPVFSSNAAAASSPYPLLTEVESLLDQTYLYQDEIPDATNLQYAAVRGVLSALSDRNTFFIEPAVAQSESQALAGTYGGIGVQLQRSESGDFILFPFEDSPAIQSGVEDGDILVAVNGQPVDITIQQDVLDQMLRGEVTDGNGVEITVVKLTGDELTIFVPFDVINVPSVIWRILPDTPAIGYIHILRFTNRTPDELTAAIDSLRDSGIAALILDLRNNGGGLLQESVQVTGMFLDGGVVLYEVRRSGEKTFTADSGGPMTDLPLVVLVNNGTASASELVAGAIRDRDRGILIGQRTFGKGTIQQIYTLSDSSSIHVTSAEWFTPGRSVIDGTGLEPDIPMIPDENGRDVEIGEAVRYLQSEYLQSPTQD